MYSYSFTTPELEARGSCLRLDWVTYWDCLNNKSKLSNKNSNNDKNKLTWMDFRNNNPKTKIFFLIFFINFLYLTDWILSTWLISLDYEILEYLLGIFYKFKNVFIKFFHAILNTEVDLKLEELNII